ncbi:hypothetical protein [Microbispora sp. CSR-4]|uniref:hypothetical protein n=1 Tax=Microbispora sp. CSR-4 TaxID=2592813 RepID=UPI0011CC92F3|nr:hypothetical protein [Microbispora sp. CSR-4]
MAVAGRRLRKALLLFMIPLALLILAALLVNLVASSWAGRPLIVDERAVRQVQGIGRQMGEAAAQRTQSDYMISRRYLFLAVDGMNMSDALERRADLLVSRGWKVENDRTPDAIHLESDELEAYLTLSPLDAYLAQVGFDDYRVKEVATRVRKQSGPSATILVAVLEHTWP